MADATSKTNEFFWTYHSLGPRPLPLLHAIGFPALGQEHAADDWLPSQSDVIISVISIKISTKPANFVLQAFTNGNFDDVEPIVVDLDIWARVYDQETFQAVDFG